MAICPFATRKLIPPGENDPRIEARIAILHVDGGDAESLHDYFAERSGGIESHFFVRKDGIVEQYRDTDFEADANYRANGFAVSIETQGLASGAWTRNQVRSIKRLLRWLSRTHGIPLRKVSSSTGSGVGYHVQFGAPGPWTPSAKSCPGPERIAQFEKVLVPWMARCRADARAAALLRRVRVSLTRRLRAALDRSPDRDTTAWLRSVLTVVRRQPE
jgi:hypothetical protein